MPEPLTAFAAKEAAIIGSGLAKEGYQFVRRIQQAPEKARGFESRINAAENILRNAASNLSETEVVQPHLAAVRTAVVAAQSKHEYELRNPKSGKISKTSVATSDASIDRLKDDIGGALQGLGTSVGLHTLLVQGSPAAYEELLRRHEVQQRQWFEERLQMLKQQMFQEFALSQQQLLQNVFGSMMQPIEQHTTALQGLLPQLQQATLTDKLPPANGNDDTVFTFVADITAALGSIIDVESDDALNNDPDLLASDFGNTSLPQEFIINRADRPDGLPDDELIVVFSRWRPEDGLRRFEIHSRACDLLRFLPDYDCPYIGWRDYQQQLQKLAAILSPNIIPHSSQTGCLLLELGDVASPLQVRCRKPGEGCALYPQLSAFAGCGLPCYDESKITVLDSIAGWVYKVRIDGHIFARKDVVDSSQLESFIGEVEALYELQDVNNIVKLYGLVTSGAEGVVKGMLLECLEPLSRRISSKYGLIGIDETADLSELSGVSYRRERDPGIKIMEDMLQIVVDVHENGFIIGELVGAQFGLTADNRVKLLGIKKRGHPSDCCTPETRARFDVGSTSTSFREGIFDEAPRRLSSKSDIWQLGALFLAMRVGWDKQQDWLFVGDAPIVKCGQSTMSRWYNDWLQPIIWSCLKTFPEDRPSASRLLQMFQKTKDAKKPPSTTGGLYPESAARRNTKGTSFCASDEPTSARSEAGSMMGQFLEVPTGYEQRLLREKHHSRELARRHGIFSRPIPSRFGWKGPNSLKDSEAPLARSMDSCSPANSSDI
ncbi:hypothetical protein LTR27_008879 [Elasticomyces elasticus]|nr:hypothetical protein LTR27_008879 [Elasticomyces elasticus]